MEQRLPTPSISWFLILAICLHLLLTQLQSVQRVLPSFSALRDSLSPIEIERAPESSRKEVVQTSKALQQDPSEAPAQYGAEFKNRVKEETQSARKGRFEERLERSGGANSQEMATPDGDLPLSAGPKLSDLLINPASPNILKGVKEGAQTLLNSDKVVYASFLNRIADEIYDVWVNRCQDAIKQVYSQGRKMSPNVFITKLGIVMDGNGKVISLQVMESSGLQELDDAPKQAFWETEPFPHPPKQLVEEDGFVRLTYEFHFQWNTSAFSIVPRTI